VSHIFAKIYKLMNRLFTALFVVVFLVSCTKEKKDVCNYDPCLRAAPVAEVSQVESYLASASITTATKHCSGLYYIIDVSGSGSATPTICSTVSVKYKGQLIDGTVFDQATSPVSFLLDGLIESWKKAIPLMTGGKIRVYCPPSLAYGSQEIRNGAGVVVIPANSILIFEIELNGVY
jgi:FKBP-type peptidyl-prolyl cis-trans isomerase FkpA